MNFFQALNNQINPLWCNDKNIVEIAEFLMSKVCFFDTHYSSVIFRNAFECGQHSLFYAVEEHLSGDLH